MQRLLAALAAAAFVTACADQATTAPTSRLHPGHANAESDPPPPPLSGAGRGFLDAGGGDLAVTASAVSSSATPTCASSHSFILTYNFSYLLTNTQNNEMAHLDMTGNVNGQVVIRDLGNGKSDAHGRVTDALFAFDITDGLGAITYPTFFYSISGTLTNLTTGQKCTTTGFLNGDLPPFIPD